MFNSFKKTLHMVDGKLKLPHIMTTYQRLSPALLVGSSVVWYTLTHHSHGAVFGHDTVTFSEHWPLIWERTWHQAFLIRDIQILVIKKAEPMNINISQRKGMHTMSGLLTFPDSSGAILLGPPVNFGLCKTQQ